jgi:hypothetical protein
MDTHTWISDATPKIALLRKHLSLTQEQYDALPEKQKHKNWVDYFGWAQLEDKKVTTTMQKVRHLYSTYSIWWNLQPDVSVIRQLRAGKIMCTICAGSDGRAGVCRLSKDDLKAHDDSKAHRRNLADHTAVIFRQQSMHEISAGPDVPFLPKTDDDDALELVVGRFVAGGVAPTNLSSLLDGDVLTLLKNHFPTGMPGLWSACSTHILPPALLRQL